MANKQIPSPTDAELEILLVLWANGPCSVRFVNENLNEKKPVGYTTTLKFMQIMNEKGLTKRDTSSRTHIYSANVLEKETQNRLLDTFLDATFRGSAMRLVMQTLGNHNTTKEELEQIKALIQNIESNES
jgi:predicted transcriptional regulator